MPRESDIQKELEMEVIDPDPAEELLKQLGLEKIPSRIKEVVKNPDWQEVAHRGRKRRRRWAAKKADVRVRDRAEDDLPPCPNCGAEDWDTYTYGPDEAHCQNCGAVSPIESLMADSGAPDPARDYHQEDSQEEGRGNWQGTDDDFLNSIGVKWAMQSPQDRQDQIRRELGVLPERRSNECPACAEDTFDGIKCARCGFDNEKYERRQRVPYSKVAKEFRPTELSDGSRAVRIINDDGTDEVVPPEVALERGWDGKSLHTSASPKCPKCDNDEWSSSKCLHCGYDQVKGKKKGAWGDKYKRRPEEKKESPYGSGWKRTPECPRCFSSGFDGVCRHCGLGRKNEEGGFAHENEEDMRTHFAREILAFGDGPITNPQRVDTLRKEEKCAYGLGSDDCGLVDGSCDVCGYQKPVEGLDDPDTERAPKVNKYLEQAQQKKDQKENPSKLKRPGRPSFASEMLKTTDIDEWGLDHPLTRPEQGFRNTMEWGKRRDEQDYHDTLIAGLRCLTDHGHYDDHEIAPVMQRLQQSRTSASMKESIDWGVTRSIHQDMKDTRRDTNNPITKGFTYMAEGIFAPYTAIMDLISSGYSKLDDWFDERAKRKLLIQIGDLDPELSARLERGSVNLQYAKSRLEEIQAQGRGKTSSQQQVQFLYEMVGTGMDQIGDRNLVDEWVQKEIDEGRAEPDLMQAYATYQLQGPEAFHEEAFKENPQGMDMVHGLYEDDDPASTPQAMDVIERRTESDKERQKGLRNLKRKPPPATPGGRGGWSYRG